MTSPRTEPIQRLAAAFLAAALLLFIFLTAFQKQHWDTDIFWALKSGEWIISHMEVPRTDPFSYTFAGKEWVDFTWGFQVIVYMFFKAGGWAGLAVLQVLLTGGTFFFIWLASRLYAPGKDLLALTIMLMVFAASSSRFFIRPHLFEYFFISLYFLLLAKFESGGKLRYLLALFPLQTIWVNLHSSAVLGIFILGAFAAGEIFDEARRDGFRPKSAFSKKARLFIISAFVLPLFSLINPYGVKLAFFPFIHQGGENADALKHIAEWVKPDLLQMFFFWNPFNPERLGFITLLLASVVPLAQNIRKAKGRDFIMLAAALYMAATHVRWAALFVYFTAPMAVFNLSTFLDSRGQCGRWKALFAGVSFFGAFLIGTYASLNGLKYFGVGLTQGNYPETTVAFMKREGVRGNIYNDYIFGGYIIYEAPEVKVFIDGRTPTVYSPYFFWKSRLVNDDSSWNKLVAEYGINIVLIKNNERMCVRLNNDADWAAVVFDDVSVLFLKRTDEFESIIKKHDLKGLNPCAYEKKFELPEERKEIERLRGIMKSYLSDPVKARSARAHRILGLVDLKLGTRENMSEAEMEFLKSLEHKQDAYTWYDLGTVRGRLKKRHEALSAFKKAISMEKKFKDAWLGAGLAYYDAGDSDAAAKYLEEYIRLADDESDPLAYKTLGLSYMNLSRLDKAAIYLKRAGYRLHDPKETAEIHYKTGMALFELGELEEGTHFFSKAIEAEPEYLRVVSRLADLFEKGSKTEKAQMLRSVMSSAQSNGKK